MGWRGTLRTIQAAQNRAKREALARQRELEKKHKILEKQVAFQNASQEVAEYENYLEVLLSLHKEKVKLWDWNYIQKSTPPLKPVKSNKLELVAQKALDNYKPGFFEKLFNQVNSKRDVLTNKLNEAILLEDKEYRSAIQKYEKDFAEWESLVKLSKRILNKEPKAYLDAINQIRPFDEINQLGTKVIVNYENDLVVINLRIKNLEIIPSEKKSLLKTGKLSINKLSKNKIYEYYQDYVCSTILRTAKEIFALLPIDKVIISAVCLLLNSQTGFMEPKPILSVFIPKANLNNLNLDLIDPSDSMVNFLHNMNFQKTKGFSEVKIIEPDNLQV